MTNRFTRLIIMRSLLPILILMMAPGLSFRASGFNTDTIAVFSAVMHKNIKCTVILPANYQRVYDESYPAIYLLHGYSGNYAQWPTFAPQLQKRSDEMNCLFICPDGGYGSWYFDSPIDSTIRYETFISQELVSYIDSHYRTRASRSSRAITGLSMGGHGALYLSFRHPDLFGAAGSISGGVDFRPFPDNWDLKKDLGDTSCCLSNWTKNTVLFAAGQIRNRELAIIFDCGTADFFIEVNRSLHALLLQRKIEHDYIERPGGHTADYWENSIDYQLLFFKKFFEDRVKPL